MNRRLFPTALTALALLGVTGLASAAGWSDYKAAFPGLPCLDGWASCNVGGVIVTPGGVTDASGRPAPADLRLGFFDLEPLPGFSPFSELSTYTGELKKKAEPVAKAEPAPPRESAPRAETSRGGDEAPSRNTEVASTRPAVDRGSSGGGEEPPRTVGSGSPVSRIETSSGSDRGSSGSGSAPSTSRQSEPVAYVAPTPTPTPTPTPSTQPATASQAIQAIQATQTPSASQGSQDGSADVSAPSSARSTAPVDDGSCDDLVALEAPAMMGQLGVGRRKCLEERLGSEAAQTSRNKISRVLMSDAEARRDQADWERLIKNHLENIDRSDPNLCLKYAIHLSRGGVGRASGVIRWADYALENKQNWSGATYTKNVNGLYKLRAQAASQLWQAAEQKVVEERSDENESKADKLRGQAKNLAREWLDYARASGQDTKAPMALCVSAAGNKEFCEG